MSKEEMKHIAMRFLLARMRKCGYPLDKLEVMRLKLERRSVEEFFWFLDELTTTYEEDFMGLN